MRIIQKLTNGPVSVVRKINEIIEAANAFLSMSGDGLVKVRHTLSGASVAIDTKSLEARMPKTAGGLKIHKAFVKTTPAAVETVACFLDTDATGTEVTVNCSVIGGSALNSAVPRLADGELIFVASVGGAWWCLTTFQASQVC